MQYTFSQLFWQIIFQCFYLALKCIHICIDKVLHWINTSTNLRSLIINTQLERCWKATFSPHPDYVLFCLFTSCMLKRTISPSNLSRVLIKIYCLNISTFSSGWGGGSWTDSKGKVIFLFTSLMNNWEDTEKGKVKVNIESSCR